MTRSLHLYIGSRTLMHDGNPLSNSTDASLYLCKSSGVSLYSFILWSLYALWNCFSTSALLLFITPCGVGAIIFLEKTNGWLRNSLQSLANCFLACFIDSAFFFNLSSLFFSCCSCLIATFSSSEAFDSNLPWELQISIKVHHQFPVNSTI